MNPNARLFAFSSESKAGPLPERRQLRAALMIASMCARYFSSARRPAAVRRYSVRGTRPSNVFSHPMYCASSSLRAWTLRLPSVV